MSGKGNEAVKENIKEYIQEKSQKEIIPTKNREPVEEANENEIISSTSTNCAYKNCPKLRDDVINVHIICHTHLDPGWLNSVDGYFYGIHHAAQHNYNGQAYRHSMPSVLSIFNNVMSALLENSKRRFVFAEMSFIWRWWKRLDEDFKKIIRKLLNDGRLDIAGGNWVSNDEAVSHYAAMIDQCTLGFRFVKDELRICSQPAVAWQLDLFGHGREINSLFAQMGYDAILFGRLDYQEKEQRTIEKTLQMIWKVNENAPQNEQWLFTGILPNLYHPPETLALKSDTIGALLRPTDADTLPESASVYSKRLLDELRSQQSKYNSTNIAVIYGGDFEYEDATQYFQNIDAMIDTINRVQNKTNGQKQFHVHYSTPSCFIHALSQEKRSWPVRKGDFLSYAHRAHAFWTGFYTSRPGIKFYERSVGAFYQSLRQLSIYSNSIGFDVLSKLGETMGLMQHHDTITGTSPLVHIEDALRRMHRAETSGQALALTLYQNILTPTISLNWSTPLIFCPLNESYCTPLATMHTFSAIVYNPSSVSNQVWIRIPVTKQQTIHLDAAIAKKFSIDVTEIGTINLSPSFLRIPLGFPRNQVQELIIRVHVPPLSLQAIPFISSKQQQSVEPLVSTNSSCSIENQHYILTVNEQGSIVSLKLKSLDKEINFQQNFSYYTSSGSDGKSHQQSGLYVFRPVGTNPPKQVNINEFYCLKRKGYEEITQVYSSFGSQVIRLLDSSSYIEFDWVVGRLDANVEFVTSYESRDLNNAGTFYTDSSGRSLMKRIRDQRDGYRFSQSETSAGNYYPLVTGIIIKDEKQDLQLSVITDRAQGGGSIKDGQVEIMLHRRTMTDDGLGVSETLNEVDRDGQGIVIRGRHLLSVTKIDEGIKFFREHALKSVWKPIIAFQNEYNNPPLNYKTWSLLKTDLPPQVNILTIEPLNQNKDRLSILFRIEHIYEPNEHPTLSKPISIRADKIFNNHKMLEIKEVTLGANMYKNEAFKRLKWTLDETNEGKNQHPEVSIFDGKTIQLSPMQIRSFIVKLENRA
ncbi:unnamed protein product [Rotaria socialis]|nr:unnamed protein product [Rotaria socialis]CAF3736244.1 unnamed protein product [Rotaria socialis]CAF4286756.1 unnamed protein product [Rotaria socialis]CAF4430033.1 unnamed protein product [Rotaria socialis]CAF4531795.1 unnamed protein product [Rotaria socialis]